MGDGGVWPSAGAPVSAFTWAVNVTCCMPSFAPRTAASGGISACLDIYLPRRLWLSMRFGSCPTTTRAPGRRCTFGVRVHPHAISGRRNRRRCRTTGDRARHFPTLPEHTVAFLNGVDVGHHPTPTPLPLHTLLSPLSCWRWKFRRRIAHPARLPPPCRCILPPPQAPLGKPFLKC